MQKNPISFKPELGAEEEDAIDFHARSQLKAKVNSGKNQVFSSSKVYGSEDLMKAANGTLGAMSSEQKIELFSDPNGQINLDKLR